MYENAQYERKQDGAIIIDGIEVATTRQCCHCGNHFVSIRGSGTVRGFCTGCAKITCGALACNPCVAFEKRMDLYEKGKISSLL